MFKDHEYLAIVGYYDADVSWAKKLIIPHIIYYKDQPDKEPFSAVNKGKGETNTLKFIYEFYDDLPKNLIQVHQYEKKNYHTGSLVDILNDPNLNNKFKASLTPGYLSLNNIAMGAVRPQISHMKKSGWWDNCMANYFGDITSSGNFTEGRKACSQFIVSRERIRSLPKEFYLNMYNWIINNTLDEETTSFDPVTLTRLPTRNMWHSNSNWYTSRYMEWSWELIFTSWKAGEDYLALYGYGNFYVDVSDRFVKFLVNGKLVIPGLRLNQCFGDVNCGYEKRLKVKLNGEFLEFDENWNRIL